MKFTKEFSAETFRAWSGAKHTIIKVLEEGLDNQLEALLEDVFCDRTPTETEVNDFLWFEQDYIFEQLGIKEEDEEDDEE